MATPKVALLGVLLSAACSVGPNYVKPATHAPTTWQARAVDARMSDDTATLDQWWTAFGDTRLNQLIEAALAQSLDARAALNRILAARIERRTVESGQGPSLNLDGGANRQDNPFPGLAEGLKFNLFEVGFDARWELDLFGRVRRRAEAATANIEATQADYRAVLATLAADVARAYFDYRTVQRQLDIRSATLKLAQATAKLTAHRAHAGVGTRHDTLRASAQVAEFAADIANLDAQKIIALRQLELLLTLEPGGLTATLGVAGATPPPTTPKVLLTPAAVIRNRPDIVRAERQLAASTALKAAAIADLYPRISLGAFFGLRSTLIGGLFAAASESWNAGGNVVAPLFDGGRLRAAVDLSDTQIEASAVAYEKTVLNALHETEIALTRLLQEEHRQTALALAVADLREATRLSHRRYEEGVSSFLEVLDAERELARAELAAATSSGSVTTYAVAVFKALGGGVSPAATSARALAAAPKSRP